MKNNFQFSIFNFLIIFISVLFLACPKIAFASGASLYLSPNSGTFFVGATFDVSIFVNTGSKEINTIEANLKFDPKKVQIVNPAVGKSFISVWVAQPSYSNINGTITFQGGVPSPGINTSSGLVSTITFRAISPGQISIEFLDSSKVLLNDGKGTNILNSSSKGVYEITVPPPEGPKIFSPSHSDQNKWYQNNNPSFGWEMEAGVEEFSYSLDHSLYGAPDNTGEGKETSISYNSLEDGVWYFHIKARRGKNWGGISHYLVQIDTTPPAAFTPSIDPILRQPNITTDQPIVTFFTTDALSGVAYYQIKIVDLSKTGEAGTGFFVEANSPYKISKLSAGEYEIVVRAFDNAGNWRDSSKKIEVSEFQKAFYSTQKGLFLFNFFIPWLAIIIAILILILIVIFFSWSYSHSYKKLEEKRRKLSELIEKSQSDRKALEEKLKENNKINSPL